MQFGATLRLLRLQSGLGLRDLARRVGVSSAYLSRVENGLDPAPTAARIEHLARELGVPETLLLDLAHRVSPLVSDYIERVPEAGTLFLEMAHRHLDAGQLAELRAFLDRSFPASPLAEAISIPPLSTLLVPERIVVGVQCTSIESALDVAADRLAGATDPPSAAELAAAFRRHEGEAPSGIGRGVAVPCASVPAVPEAAALITLAAPLEYPTPDRAPLRLVIVLVAPPKARDCRIRLAHVARLSTRGLADALAPLETPSEILARLALLERVR